MNIIDIRRSVRKFRDQQIEDDKIEQILRAGMQAPSAGNQQPWEFVLVKNKKIKAEVSKMSPYASFAEHAPVIIVVLGHRKYMRFPENMQQDLGACTQNMLLEAVNQGLGSTWLSVCPQEDRISHLEKTLVLPNDVVPYAVVTIGYPLHEDDNRYIDRYDSKRVHLNQY